VFHRTQVETFNGVLRNTNGAIYRFEPQTNKLTRHVPYGFANPHGRVFDYWGNDIITDATGNANYFGPGLLQPPGHRRPRRLQAVLEPSVASLPGHRAPEQPPLP
jgi:hypothetical protein